MVRSTGPASDAGSSGSNWRQHHARDRLGPCRWTIFGSPGSLMRAGVSHVISESAVGSKIVHLHGLNLSRAWCWRQLLPEL